MLQKFRSYGLAVELYKLAKPVVLHPALKDQLLRASSSVCLNLAEGSAKISLKDRRRFYVIALGSLREVQTLIDLEETALSSLRGKADILGAHIYKLTRQ